ncbi:mannose-6-phosphate isomerase [Olsenella sp. oral taxon 807]|uniref:type I phosphomannose isomerase catalytic subunit n=1 Tax=Olsenella sp. oral taxon 807 TaxID=712411 RepID=UPI00067A1D0D|nr:type I phosphomannose isomerase catalytic subunit [Olsenella sp. oral taxon 807]AKT49173.1 mannose-6-phosphate isomerase [Olsenella sp. oral taxon 807]
MGDNPLGRTGALSPEMDLIRIEPVFHEKIWGGRKLETEFGYTIPDGPIGECWAISAHPAGDCHVRDGAYAGMLLSSLWTEHHELFGAAEGDRFPLLIKFLDAAKDLSIQVHPDDAYAAEHEGGSLGKCECWYVLHADPNATIVVGQRAKSPEEFGRLVEEGRWSELLNEVPVHAGDFFQIAPGTVHAIKGGTMVLETQQSSDITYRVYDYDRVQADGTKRELHLQKSLDVIDFGAKPITSGRVSAPTTNGITQLVCCPRYTVWHVRATGTATLSSPKTFYCASVIEGTGRASDHELRKGDHFIVPAGYGTLRLEGDMQLIVSTVPANEQAA